MTYALNVTGHVVRETVEEARQLEEEIVAKARALIAELEGVTAAHFSGQHVSVPDLTEAAT